MGDPSSTRLKRPLYPMSDFDRAAIEEQKMSYQFRISPGGIIPISIIKIVLRPRKYPSSITTR